MLKQLFIIDAFLFLFALIVFSRINFEVKASKVDDKIFALIKDGFIYIKNNKLILQLIFLHSCVGLTTFDALVTLLAKNEYKYIIAVPLAIGISNALRAVALMIGPYFISKYVNKNNLDLVLYLQGLAIILWGFTQFNFYISLIFIFCTGLFTTILWSFTYALLQENCDEKYIGRVISYNDMFFMLVGVITTLFIGFMASYTSLVFITVCIGLAFIAFGLYYKGLKKCI